MNREELIQEIIYSLPSKQLLDVVMFGAVAVNGELVVLKNRLGYIPEDTIRYERHYRPFVQKIDLSEIQGKNVIFSEDTLSRRGLLAIAKLSNLMMEEVLNDESV